MADYQIVNLPVPVADRIEEYRYLASEGRLRDAELMGRELSRELARSHPEAVLVLEAIASGHSGIEFIEQEESVTVKFGFPVERHLRTKTRQIRIIP
jgi:hypothetical protein